MMMIYTTITRMIHDTKQTNAPVLQRSHLYTDLGFDSLSYVHLLLAIEEIYAIEFALTEMESCLEVHRLVELVKAKVGEFEHDKALIDRSKGL